MRAIQGAEIKGICATLPRAVREVGELNELFGTKEIEKIIKSTGIERTHIVDDKTTTLDLCVASAESLLSELNVDKNSIDTVIFVSQTPDFTLPASSCIAQHRLGLRSSCAAFDVGLGCSGYTYGLWIGMCMIAAGVSKSCLLLVGDTISKIVDPQDRSVAPIFGDAGSATLIGCSDGSSNVPFVVGTDGAGAENLIVPAGAFRDRSGTGYSSDLNLNRDPFSLYMNGAAVFSFTLQRVFPMIRTLESAVGVDGIDKYVLHQANSFMLNHIAKKLDISAGKFVNTLKDFGNTSSASIPLALVSAAENGGIGTALLAGFGVGYSWSACVVDLSKTKFCKINLL